MRMLQCVNGKLELARAGGGRLDDDGEVSVGDAAGTAARPVRVQAAGQPLDVERVDDIPHGVFVRGRQAGDRRHCGAGGRGHDDQRATNSDRPMLTPPHQAQ